MEEPSMNDDKRKGFRMIKKKQKINEWNDVIVHLYFKTCTVGCTYIIASLKRSSTYVVLEL